MTTLPVLDLRRLNAGSADRDAFLAELRHAVRDVGFYYVTGHGIAPAVLEEAYQQAHAFFRLPEAEKDAIAMVNSPHFRGYTRSGGELTRGRPDWREQLDIGSERPAARTIGKDAPPWARLPGPNQWPVALPSLRPALLSWQQAATIVATRLLRAFALALEQPANALDPIFAARPGQHVKIIRYPARDAGQDRQGVGPHKDSGLLTLVYQPDLGGLEVETDAGWISAPPLPDAFVVNSGELLELATDGYIRATTHRVTSPSGDRDRISIAFFLGADLDAEVPLLPLPPHLKAEARGISADPLNPLFRGIGANYLKGRLRSHPDVAQRHYADLLVPGA